MAPSVHAFEVLAEAPRRRLIELPALGEQPAGVLTEIVRAEHGISQPAVSQHLRVLREEGFATVRAEGARRIYALDPAGLPSVSYGAGRQTYLERLTTHLGDPVADLGGEDAWRSRYAEIAPPWKERFGAL